MSNKQLTFGDERLHVCLTDADGSLSLTVTDRLTGRCWESSLLALEVCDRMQERVERRKEYRTLIFEATGQGAHVTVRDIFRGVTVGLWLSVEHGELSVLAPPAEVEEADPALYRVYTVDLLPELMRCGPDGVLLIPVNTGMLCHPANKACCHDRFLIYGEQERWELVPTTPVCGVQTPEGGLVCLAVQGACDTWCTVSTDGRGTGQIGMGAMLRRAWLDPVDWEQRELVFMPLEPQADLVLAAARRLRRHIREDLGKPTLAERAAESPQVAYQNRAFTMKLFYGIQNQGIMMYGKQKDPNKPLYLPTMTFAQAGENLKRLKAAGVERIYTQQVGWNTRGHDGDWPTRFPVEQRAGGERAFRELLTLGNALGYAMTVHDNCASACFGSPDFDPDYVITDMWGEPKVVGFWGGGIKGTHWGLALPAERIEAHMHYLKELGCTGMYYLDGIGNPLYVNYHRKYKGPRRHHALGINRYLETAKRIFGAVETEMGFLYCAVVADALCTGGSEWQRSICKPEWPITALLEQRVPVWELALHGLVTRENTDLSWNGVMDCVLFADVPRDEWSAMPGVMPVLDDLRIAQIKAKYDICLERFGHLIPQELTSWSRPAEGVQRTTFADGTEVIADTPGQELLVNGRRVERPAVLAKQ